jgi:bacteriocin-like protein
MKKEKNWEELLKWASLNEENRKEAIISASKFITVLTMTSDKKISEDELKNITGGKFFAPLCGEKASFMTNG